MNILRRFGVRISREERRGREVPMRRAFRAWWGKWRLEWSFPTSFIHARISIDPGEGEVQVGFACKLFAIWLSREVKSKRLWDWHKRHWRYEEVEIGFGWNDCSCSFLEGFLHWELLVPTNDWDSKTPKWRQGTFHPLDFVLGRDKHERRDITSEDVQIPMPEGTYPAKVTLFESTWTRPRWPFVRRMIRSDVEMKVPIPHPGKGENSWDCGDDATYSLTCPAQTVADAIGAVVGSVMRSRINYGSKHWRAFDGPPRNYSVTLCPDGSEPLNAVGTIMEINHVRADGAVCHTPDDDFAFATRWRHPTDEELKIWKELRMKEAMGNVATVGDASAEVAPFSQ